MTAQLPTLTTARQPQPHQPSPPPVRTAAPAQPRTARCSTVIDRAHRDRAGLPAGVALPHQPPHRADFAAGNPFALPTAITLDNYARAFETGNLGLNILNSLIVTLGASVLIVLLGMMAAYALQVLGFRFSKVVRGLFLLGIIVPVQIALVPLFIDYSQIGLLDTYLSMIIPLAGFALPMSIYLFSSFFEYIPREMYEAASLDGAGPYRIFGQITLPLSVNTIVTVVLVNSIFIWNDFIFANTFVLSEGLKTIPLGLQNYIGAMGKTDWTATFAAVCVTVTPLLLVFLVLNKAMITAWRAGRPRDDEADILLTEDRRFRRRTSGDAAAPSPTARPAVTMRDVAKLPGCRSRRSRTSSTTSRAPASATTPGERVQRRDPGARLPAERPGARPSSAARHGSSAWSPTRSPRPRSPARSSTAPRTRPGSTATSCSSPTPRATATPRTRRSP